MDNFDKIVKEKVNQINVPYKASAWKSFCLKAGIKSGISFITSVAIISATVITIISGLLIGKHILNQKEQITSQFNQENVESIALDRDTTIIEQDFSTEPIASLPIEEVQADVSPQMRVASPVLQPQDTAPRKPLVPDSTVIINNDKWRISIINADTILEN